MTTWGAKGRALAEELENTVDEKTIKRLGIKTLEDIYASVETFEGRENALKMVSREIRKKFPHKYEQAPLYFHDPMGKTKEPKWKHLVFQTLTLRETQSAEEPMLSTPTVQPEQPTDEVKPPTPMVQPEQPTIQQRNQSAKQPRKQSARQPKEILKTMDIQQLGLDNETETILKNALAESQMPLDQFIKQAIKVYAKTITGKAKQQNTDLSSVPTATLLDDPKYSTHPLRAQELTKRAIQAIKFFNANKATEAADRWCITQSAIASLTGSRQSTIKQILEQYKDEVETHNQTYGLTGYSNRKPGKDIADIINLAEIVPDGVN